MNEQANLSVERMARGWHPFAQSSDRCGPIMVMIMKPASTSERVQALSDSRDPDAEFPGSISIDG